MPHRLHQMRLRPLSLSSQACIKRCPCGCRMTCNRRMGLPGHELASVPRPLRGRASHSVHRHEPATHPKTWARLGMPLTRTAGGFSRCPNNSWVLGQEASARPSSQIVRNSSLSCSTICLRSPLPSSCSSATARACASATAFPFPCHRSSPINASRSRWALIFAMLAMLVPAWMPPASSLHRPP